MARDDTAAIIKTLEMMLMDPIGVFNNMNIVTKACTAVGLVCLIATVAMAVMRRSSGAERSSLLATIGTIGLAAGGLGGLYEAFVTWQAMQMLHETRFLIVLPSFVEAGAAILIGLMAWQTARIGNSGAQK